MSTQKELDKLKYRLSKIASWENGYCDGDGKKAHPKSLENAEIILNKLIHMGLKKPRIGLDEDGHICAEFDGKSCSTLLEFTPTHVESQAMDFQNKRVWEENFDVSGDIRYIYTFIQGANSGN